MTDAIATLPEGLMRVVPSEIGPVVPVIDIAALINYSSDHLTKKIRENPDLFKGRQVLPDLPTAGGMQKCVCVDRVGFDRLLLLLKPSKDRDIFERIEAFRLKAFGQLAGIKNEIAPVQPEPDEPDELDEVVAYDLREAAQIAELTKVDPKMMQAAILRKHGYKELADVLAPPLVHGESGWHKPGDLARQCGLTTEMFNNWLNNNPKDPDRRPFQYKDHDTRLWRLTPLGMEHGAEYPYTVEFTGHTEVRIKWRESILKACGLKRDIAPDQTALPARAGR